jgi:hypothetical protein
MRSNGYRVTEQTALGFRDSRNKQYESQKFSGVAKETVR